MRRVGKEFAFLVVGDRCWGTAPTEGGARKKCMRAGGRSTLDTYLVYLVPPDAVVTPAGDVRWADPAGEAVLLKKVRTHREQPLTDEDV